MTVVVTLAVESSAAVVILVVVVVVVVEFTMRIYNVKMTLLLPLLENLLYLSIQ